MILTPIDAAVLPRLLASFSMHLDDPAARKAFRRIAIPGHAERAGGGLARLHHDTALALARACGMGIAAGDPASGVSWDGTVLRSKTEAYVLIHEIAHFQLAPPERRGVIDFGLGPGPETGDRMAAEQAARVFGVAREAEEARASLLGILWEAELGHPALASFLDQNWLEGAGRPGTAQHFATTLQYLRAGGFIDDQCRPTTRLRQDADPPQFRLRCGVASCM
jgi:hypothetical protein